MNSKLNFQDLSAKFAVVAGLSEDESKEFIKCFFDEIEHALLQGETVTVKGFGQFRITGDSAGRTVEFIPDSEIADEINAPFSQFEPTEVRNDITDKMLNDVTADIDGPEEEIEPDEEPIYIPLEPIDTPAAESEEETEEPVAEPEPLPYQPVIIEEDDEEVTSEPDSETSEESEDVYDEEVSEAAHEEKSGFGMGFLVGILVGLAIGAAATFFYTNMIADSYRHSETEEVVEDEPEEIVTDVPDAAPVTIDSVINEAPEEQPVAVVTDKIAAGYLMPKMAQKHYGNSVFWVYIYEENKGKIKNVDNVPIGLELVIPPASKYGIDKDDVNSIERAKALATEIYSKK